MVIVVVVVVVVAVVAVVAVVVVVRGHRPAVEGQGLQPEDAADGLGEGVLLLNITSLIINIYVDICISNYEDVL